jgi:hypothetical protein
VRTVQEAAVVNFKILPQHLLGRTKDIQNLSPVVSVNHFTVDLPCFTDRQLQFVHSSPNFSQTQIANVSPVDLKSEVLRESVTGNQHSLT